MGPRVTSLCGHPGVQWKGQMLDKLFPLSGTVHILHFLMDFYLQRCFFFSFNLIHIKGEERRKQTLNEKFWIGLDGLGFEEKEKLWDKYLSEEFIHFWCEWKLTPYFLITAATVVLLFCSTSVTHACESLPKNISPPCSLISCPEFGIWHTDKIICETQAVQWANTTICYQTIGITSSGTKRQQISMRSSSPHLLNIWLQKYAQQELFWEIWHQQLDQALLSP